MKKRIDCTFKDIPFNCEFYAFLNPNSPKDCHTLPCYKNNQGIVYNKEFKNLDLHENEPVFYYVE